jgi:hypothetical protein
MRIPWSGTIFFIVKQPSIFTYYRLALGPKYRIKETKEKHYTESPNYNPQCEGRVGTS